VTSNDNLQVDHTDIEIKNKGGLGFQSDTSNGGPLISEETSLTSLKKKKEDKKIKRKFTFNRNCIILYISNTGNSG